MMTEPDSFVESGMKMMMEQQLKTGRIKSTKLRKLAIKYQKGCGRRSRNKVLLEEFVERAVACDGCIEKRGMRCGVVGVSLKIVLPFRIHRCPMGRFEASDD